LRVESDPTLARSPGIVVLDSESTKYVDASVVHSHWNRYRILPQRVAKQLTSGFVEFEYTSCAVELPLGGIESAE
jgi:hypothetical protein